jgi:nucleoid-associated protein YgaU
MAIKRYGEVIALGTKYGVGRSHVLIRQALDNGTLSYSSNVLKGHQRLDTLAGEAYGDGTLWWVIAAASGIGWGLQVPPGTVINIPNIEQVASLLA